MLEKCINYGIRLVWILLAFHHQGGEAQLHFFVLEIQIFLGKKQFMLHSSAKLHIMDLVKTFLSVCGQYLDINTSNWNPAEKYKLNSFSNYYL